jgi:hypothetical protein
MNGVVLSRTRCFFSLSCLVFVALAGCSGGGDDSGKAQGVTAEKSAIGTAAALKLGAIDLQAVGAPPSLDKQTQAALLAGAQTYVDSAVYEPLQSGKVGAKYATLFDTSIRTAATDTDAPAMTETNVGKVDDYKATSTPVAVSGLADGLGGILYLSTNFDVNVKATTAAGPLTIKRSVELTWAPNGKQWTVTAYRTAATHKLPKRTTTTTATSGSTP